MKPFDFRVKIEKCSISTDIISVDIDHEDEGYAVCDAVAFVFGEPFKAEDFEAKMGDWHSWIVRHKRMEAMWSEVEVGFRYEDRRSAEPPQDLMLLSEHLREVYLNLQEQLEK